jgi:hypothetical protein
MAEAMSSTPPPPILNERERAQDRARNQLTSVAGGENYLGSIDVVSGLVATFVSDCADIRAAFNSGEIQFAGVESRLSTKARAFADIFMGKNSSYAVMPHWNTSAGLGSYLLARNFGDTHEDAVLAFAYYMADEIFTAMEAHEQDGDDDAGKLATESTIEDGWHMLLGLPNDEGAPPPESLALA